MPVETAIAPAVQRRDRGREPKISCTETIIAPLVQIRAQDPAHGGTGGLRIEVT